MEVIAREDFKALTDEEKANACKRIIQGLVRLGEAENDR